MTLTELRYIFVLSETKHFGEAARLCKVSQPSLSVAVKNLEDELGFAIFERCRGSIQVTPLGQEVLLKAQRVLDEINGIKDIANIAKDPLRGPLALGTLPTIGPYLLPQSVALLRNFARDLSLYVEEADIATLGKKLRSGALDVVLVTQPFKEADVVVQFLFEDEFVALLPLDHPLTAKRSLVSSDLQPTEVILLSDMHSLRQEIMALFPHLNSHHQDHSSLTGSSVEALRNMVASGLGITVLPISAADVANHARHLLTTRKFVDFKPTRSLALAWRKSFPRHQAIDVLRKALLTSSASYWKYSTSQYDHPTPLVENQYW